MACSRGKISGVDAGGVSPEEEDLYRRSALDATSKTRKPLSYKDICTGVNGGDYEEDDVVDNLGSDSDDFFVDEEDMVVDNQVVDPLCPIVKISKEELKEACKPWHNVVIVKLLGKKVGMQFLKDRLRKLWNPSGEMEVIDLDKGFFIVRFSNREDYKF